MNVVLYMRFSSARQTEQSIEGQERVCRAFCEREGYNIVGTYVDRATSAFHDTDKRTEFNRMLDDSKKHFFEAVVVYKLDRFSRSKYDFAVCKKVLKDNGVQLISATEDISQGAEGIIYESLLEAMAEYYSRELAQKVERGMKETALKCNSCGGTIPYGFRVANKKLVICEEEAAIIRRAFAMYTGGSTIKEIIQIFESEGVRPNGRPWTTNRLSNMFKNEKYAGVFRYKDVRIEGGIPAIVDKQTFEDARAKAELNKHSPGHGKAENEYLLSGKLWCGHCNYKMTGSYGVSKTGEKYYYYTCSARYHGGSCDKKPVGKEWVELIVVRDAIAMLTDETIDYIAQTAVDMSRMSAEADAEYKGARKKLAETDKKLNNIMTIIEDGGYTPTIAKRLTDLEAQKEEIERRIEEIEARTVVLDKDHLVWWLSQFREGDINDISFRRKIIGMLVQKVTIFDNPDGTVRFETIYNTSPEAKNKKFESDPAMFTTYRKLEPVILSPYMFAIIRNHSRM